MAIIDVGARLLELLIEGVGNGMLGVMASSIQKCNNTSRYALENNLDGEKSLYLEA